MHESKVCNAMKDCSGTAVRKPPSETLCLRGFILVVCGLQVAGVINSLCLGVLKGRLCVNDTLQRGVGVLQGWQHRPIFAVVSAGCDEGAVSPEGRTPASHVLLASG